MKSRFFIIVLPVILAIGLSATLWAVFAQEGSPSHTLSVRQEISEQIPLKQIGGYVYGVAKQGDYAYLTIGTRLDVLDVSDPYNPVYLSQTEPLTATTYHKSLVISGTTAYGAGDYHLKIFDLSDPVHPTVTAVYSIPSKHIRDIVISGTLLFLAESKNTSEFPGYGGLRILDTSNPLAPIELSHFGEASTIVSIASKGDFVYVNLQEYNSATTFTQRTIVLDISDLSSPQEISTLYSDSIDDLEIYGDYLYQVETMYGNIKIYDISNPSTPTFINNMGFPDNGTTHRLEISGHYAYLHNSTGIRVYDLTNPVTPTLYAEFNDSYYGGLFNVTLDNNFIYISHGPGGLIIADTTTADLNEVAHYHTYGRPTDIAEVSNYIYLLDGRDLHVLDVTDPQNPESVHQYNHQNSGHAQLIVSGTKALRASGYGSYSFEVIDITNPLSPTHQTYYFAQGNSVFETIWQGNYAYLGLWDQYDVNFEIVDMSDPTQPTLVSSVNITRNNYYNHGIEVSGNYAYMVESRGGSGPEDQLTIIDISNKLQPQVVATQPVSYTSTDEFGKSLTLLNGFAYIGGFGVRVFDVTNPLSPAPVGDYTITNASGYNYEVVSQSGHLYVSAPLEDGRTAQHIVDVSDPAHPVKIGDYDYIGGLELLVGSDVYTYVPRESLGLAIYGPNSQSDYKIYLPAILKSP